MRLCWVGLLLLVMATPGVAAVLHETFFESDADLAGWQILQATDYGIVPGVTPCGTGENVLWMSGLENTYSTAYYEPGSDWTDYTVCVWAKVTSNVWGYINVFFRIQDTGGPWYGIENGYNVHIRHHQDEIELQMVENGFGYPLQTVSYDFVEGTWYAIKIEAGTLLDPSALNVYVNDACNASYTPFISVRDSTYRSGSVAIGALSSGGVGAEFESWFDHVKVVTSDHSDPSATGPTTWGAIKALYR